MYWKQWKPYVPVATRRRQAEAEARRRRKAGEELSPVRAEGRTIARTFWGKAWCDNLERYSDFENRLPRGRTYVRNGSVIHLAVHPGRVEAMVSGSGVYTVRVEVAPMAADGWAAIRSDCAGGIDSLVELLQGRLSKGVMERICRPRSGLFPSPQQIKMSCSCPDWATMCKHVAAVLYGVGVRLDLQPELLFRLRQVDENELVAEVGRGLPLGGPAPAGDRVLDSDDLGGLFGLELEGSAPAAPKAAPVKAKATGKAKVAAKRTARATSSRVPVVPSEAERSAVATVRARVAEVRAQIAAGTASPGTRALLGPLEDWLAAR